MPALLLVVALSVAAGGAGAQPQQRVVDVVQVSGWLDRVLVEFLHQAVDTAEQEDVVALVVQLDSPGALVDDDEVAGLAARLRDADVPVAVWVGGAGSQAVRGATYLVTEAPVAGMAPGSRIGRTPALGDLDVPEALRTGTVGPERAAELGVTELNEEEAAILGTFIAALDGETVAGERLDTADFEEVDDGPPEATLSVQVRLAKLDLLPRLMHTVASPPVAYLLLAAGLVLLVLELFTMGGGVAAGTGALALLLASYGLEALPTSPLGLGLLLVAVFGFAVDIQVGAPRVWTGVGVVAWVAGSLLLYDEPVSLGWLPLLAGVLGVVVMMLAGLPATVRSRMSTPTIGREGMLGEMGDAVSAVEPEGVVRVRGAMWPARTNRATPVPAGERVRVVGIDGTRLEVEPEHGAARDHRERRRRPR